MDWIFLFWNNTITEIYFNIPFDPHFHVKHFLHFHFAFFPGFISLLTIPSIRMLFLLDLSSSCMSFLFKLGHSSVFCSISLTALSKFLMSVLIVVSLSSNWSWVSSRLLVSSVDNLFNRSFVYFIFEFISSLIVALWVVFMWTCPCRCFWSGC